MDLSVAVLRAAATSLTPSPKRTEAYEKRVAYEALAKAVDEVVVVATSGARLTQSDVDRARVVERDVTSARFTFPDLVEKAKSSAAAVAESFEKQERDDAETRFRQEAERLSGILAGSAPVADADASAARQRQAQLAASRFRFPDLDGTIGELVPALERRAKLEGLTPRRDALEARLAAARRARRGLRIAGWLSLGVGVAGVATGVASYFLGQQAYADYAAAVSADAEAAWARVVLFTGLLNAGIISGSGGCGVGLVLVLVAPGTSGLERELAAVRQELERQQGETK